MFDHIELPTAEELKLNRQKWLDALRSGAYEQTTGCLQDKDGFCCLGVLADVYEKDTGDILPKRDDGTFIGTGLIHMDGFGMAFSNVAAWVGLHDDIGRFKNSSKFEELSHTVSGSLAQLNDQYRVSFTRIADMIEAEPEDLFIG